MVTARMSIAGWISPPAPSSHARVCREKNAAHGSLAWVNQSDRRNEPAVTVATAMTAVDLIG
jgi:hypothetical protein